MNEHDSSTHARAADAPTPTPDFNEENPGPTGAASRLEVDAGKAMPPTQSAYLPLLHVPASASDPMPSGTPACSLLAEGMQFVGNAVLRGPCSVAGQFEGNLSQAPGTLAAVVVAPSGRVKGDITAHKIAVMGQTDGLLDSGQGEVTLHDSASVSGRVRYGRIQVNGADLNATLERVPTARH